MPSVQLNALASCSRCTSSAPLRLRFPTASPPCLQRELLRAKRTLITRHDSDLKVCGLGSVPAHVFGKAFGKQAPASRGTLILPCAPRILQPCNPPSHQPPASSSPVPQDNLYWLSLLTHLQADCVPLKSLDCLRDLRDMYEAATVDDVYDAYAQVGAVRSQFAT